ncbi:dead end protein 1 [Pholidichthys leucotaenia]
MSLPNALKDTNLAETRVRLKQRKFFDLDLEMEIKCKLLSKLELEIQKLERDLLNVERLQALETWLKTTNIQLTQINGQRKYGGPPEAWEGPTPGPRCEVFISQIPRDAYEDLLIPLFSSVGPLWEFRLMMNFSGQNRGFAYAKYGSSAIAAEAIRLLHGHMLISGCCLSVRRSTEKRNLCIGDLPAATQQEDLLQVLRGMTEGVDRVSLKAGPGIEGASAIVTFSSHHAASMAKKMIVEAFKKRFALSIFVKWQSAEKPSPDELGSAKQPAKTLLPSPVKPPRLTHSSQGLSPPSSPIPQGFCRAVGGPTVRQHLASTCPFSSSSSSSPLQGHEMRAVSPVMLLQMLCEATGVGQPFYEILYSHTGQDGFLYFAYKVRIPGITGAFTGLVMILPGFSANTVLEDARKAAAYQVLQRVCNSQLTP